MLGINRLLNQLFSNVGFSQCIASSYCTSSARAGNESRAEPLTIVFDKTSLVEAGDESRTEALITVFGMDKEGKIKREMAHNVIRMLGLTEEGEEETQLGTGFEEDLEAKDVVFKEKGKQKEQIKDAFRVFDKDGDGFIDAQEIKRVLVCLGLDNGWDMSEIESMIRVFDLNLDGKVDFHEFELMMG